MLTLLQFFVGLPDSEVEKLLNFFTFLPQSTIRSTIQEHMKAPEKRIAQHLLAREFVELVHGVEEGEAAQKSHLNRSSVSDDSISLPASSVIGSDFATLFKMAGLAESKSKATRLISSGGAYCIPSAGQAVKLDERAIVQREHLAIGDKTEGSVLILRAGKWKTRTIVVQAD